MIYDKTDEGMGIRTLWQASTEAGFCEKKAADLVNRLSNGGYRCQQVSTAVFGEEGIQQPTETKTAPPQSSTEPAVTPEEAIANEPPAAVAPRGPAEAPVSTLEKAAGVQTAPPKALPTPKKVAETPSSPGDKTATAAAPKSRVDSYLRWLESRAAEGNKDATNELSAVKELGLARFYDQWARIFSLLDLDDRHKSSWSVGSVACEQPGCRTWLLEEGLGRDDAGYYKLHSIGVLIGRVVEVVSCVTFEGETKCVAGNKLAPVATYRPVSAAEGSYYVYENQFGGYALIYACSESMGQSNSWTHSIEVFQGEQRDPPLSGKGDCKSRILKEYWAAL